MKIKGPVCQRRVDLRWVDLDSRKDITVAVDYGDFLCNNHFLQASRRQ